MIQKAFLLCLLSLSWGMMTACKDSDNELDMGEMLIIDPENLPMFQFDEQGIPYRLDFPTLPPDMQQDIRNEVFGHGWKWMQTNEIQENGYVKPGTFSNPRYEWEPISYLFKSDNKLVKYIGHQTSATKGFLDQGFETELSRGILSDGNRPMSVIPWTFFIRIWGVYELDGRWYMSIVEPLGIEGNTPEEVRPIWGCTQFVRMTPTELKQMQETYTLDYNIIN